jgi:YfiH family protein
VKALRVETVPAFHAIPGLVHGFERRLGPPGWETREAGRARVAKALSPRGRLLLLKQVHGATVVAAPWEGFPEADAATATASGLLLGIETADCLPVLIVDTRRRAVAAAHAGWRGTAAGVTGRAVSALVAGGSRLADLVVAIGPGIGPCCYEVGGELRGAFGAQADALFTPGPRGKPHLDVRLANVRQLEAMGLNPPQIHNLAACTQCHADLYHSFRREGNGAGRMISFVGFATDAGT